MANTNFLQFDSNQTNMLSDSIYSNDTQRISGVSSGIARSNLYNKHAFQTSTMCKAIADFLVDNNVNAMDNNLTALKNSIANVFATISMDSQNVKITGTQTITGDKTFTNTIRFGSSYSGPNGFIYQQASTGSLVAGLYKEDGTWSNNYIQFYQSGSTKIIATTNVLLHGTTPATTSVNPTETTATNSTQIATAGWVNTVGNNVVHLSGAETINNVKTVTGHWNFKQEQTISNTSITKGTNPSTAQYTTLSFCDKNGTAYTANQLGNVQHKLETDGTSITSLVVIKNDANSTAGASVGVVYKDDGTTYGYSPTPPSATDNSTKIATTAWIKNASQNGDLCIPNYGARVSFSTASYTPTSNGIIVVKAHANSPSAEIAVHSDGFIISRAKMTGDGTNVVVWAVVYNGETYDTSGSGTVTRWFIPFR